MILLTALLACSEPTATTPEFEGVGDDTDASGDDLDGPLISHSGTSSPQYVGEDISIGARIVDEQNKVLVAEIHYRRQTSENWSSAGMDFDPTDGEDRYSGVIPAEQLGSAGMHYYILAVDSKNNESVYPEAAPDEYFKFDLAE